MRVQIVGANVVASVSRDLLNWETMETRAKSTIWAAAGSPDQAGIYSIGFNSAGKALVNHFKSA